MRALHLVVHLVVCGCLTSVLSAQESRPATSASREPGRLSTFGGAVEKAGSLPGQGEAAAPFQPIEREVGIAKKDGVRIRTFEAESALPFDKTLRKDERVILKGTDKAGAFFAVDVVSGLPGFVSARFVEVTEPGKGRTTGERVSFRVRPRTGEPPATLLAKGTELLLLAREGEWWRVLAPESVTAWVSKEDLERAGRPEAHQKELLALKEEADSAWRAAVEVEKVRLAREEKGAELLRRIKDAAARLDTEARRPIEEADYKGIQAEVRAVLEIATKEGLAEAPFVAEGKSLLAEVDRKRVLQEAKEALASQPPPARPPVTPAPEKLSERDPLSRFEGVGYLLYRPTPEGMSEFQLERGGQLLFYVSCSSGKYDLRSFQGCELGLRGVETRPEGARVRLLDVTHIEVLGAAR